MKKIVGIVAAASLVAGLAFADPTINVNVADFTGNAQVQWGVDLDAGATGFKNSEYMKFVINLFDAGSKKTESDNSVWAELVMNAGNTKSWTHRLYQYDKNTDFNADGNCAGIEGSELSFKIDTAKIHFGDFYVGIKNGDTVTGEYKFDGAIRGFDHWKNQGRWMKNVGPEDYSQGIVAGYDTTNLGIDVDFRSYGKTKQQYTNDYAFAVEAKLKDSNEWLEGLFVDGGFSMNLTKSCYDVASAAGTAKEELLYGKKPDDADDGSVTYVTKDLPAIMTAATKDTEGWYVKKTAAKASDGVAGEAVETEYGVTTIGYSANAGYKIKIDDKYWFKPSVAFTGSNVTTITDWKNNYTTVVNGNRLVFGAMFGWGSAADANGGVYYFDADHQSRKVCPGVSVVAEIPLATSTTTTNAAGSNTITSADKVVALIVPSFYTNGDLVEGLKAAVYSEMAILNGTASTDPKVGKGVAADKDDTFALALAAAVAYDIKADDITVTPQVGFRFVNACYDDNGINKIDPLSNDAFFDAIIGKQKKVATGTRKGLNENGFFNLKAGVNVNGLINNTDIFAVYQSANLLNGIDYSTLKNTKKNGSEVAKKYYNVKAGTFNVGCKISF
jgi:hypothetical protein